MKKSLLACALGVTLLGAGCIGPNKTFNDLHDWNLKMSDNKWSNEAVFFVFNIIPVYGVCYLADVIVLNSIEFWKSGSTSATAK